MENKTITKADIAATVCNRTGFSMMESTKMVTDVLNTINESLVSGDNANISSFGSFRILNKRARIGRNPKTKEEVVITARRVVSFHPSACLRKIVNK